VSHPARVGTRVSCAPKVKPISASWLHPTDSTASRRHHGRRRRHTVPEVFVADSYLRFEKEESHERRERRDTGAAHHTWPQRDGSIADRVWYLAAGWRLGRDRRDRRDPSDSARVCARHQLLRHSSGVRIWGIGAAARQGDPRLPSRSVVIATKSGIRPLGGARVERDASAAWVRQGVDDSLRALATDHIDLLQVHWPDPRTPFAETAGALAELVAAGKVRQVGVSNFDAGEMEEFSQTQPVETLQPPYSIFHRDIEATILPYTQAHDIGVLVYGPLAHGLLSGHLRVNTQFAEDDWRSHSPDFQGDALSRNLHAVAELEELANCELGAPVSQLAVAWTLANPAVHVAILGTRDAGHVDDAVAAASLELTGDVLSRIDQIARNAVHVDGPRPEAM